ncbi:ABC transporter permease [Plantactinospora sp. S1510]|uniref:ABC transporter permease n=1 Tax=Plantactinospora alkalitolerans TaxID=2789879 RepID=A0ABS0GXJ9_9ACTN|nr:ABC transporter permease [Plantactinospora alkalitolerans]MBF9130617.1 ABC transporter permease [Plantactinospora alkalitolerans]
MNATASPDTARSGSGTRATPRRIAIRSTAKLVVTEAKLFVREPLGAFFAIVFPAALILVLGGAMPGFTEPSADVGGRLPIEVYLPITLALAIGTVALVNLLNALAADREKGVLRRLSTTPVSPVRLLGAQLVVNVSALVVGCGLALLAAWGAFRITAHPNVPGLLIAFVLGAASMVALALLVAAFTPTGRAATGLGSLVYYPMLFAAGVWTPGPLMPDAVRRVADFTPLGAASQALQDAWAGDWPRPLHLAVMVGFTVVLGGLATKLFRWS